MPIFPDPGRLEAIWYGGAAPSIGLRLLAGLYAGARWLHGLPWRMGLLRARPTAVPVVVVGNLTVGGTGKTPLVIALVEALRARGIAVGVISRGYGRRSRGVLLVGRDSQAEEVGDEPLLIARKTRAPVAVGEDRAAALARLCGAVPLDLVIADDGLEHHRLARAFEIVVVDGQRGFGNGRLLPAGPLRAPLSRLRSVDVLVVNGAPAVAIDGVPEGLPALVMQVRIAAITPLAREAAHPLSAWRGQSAHLVAGTGHPGRIAEAARALGIEVHLHAFPDHYDYEHSGVPSFDDGLPVLTTAKDAVKLPARLAGWFVLEAEAEVDPALVERLATLAREAANG
jgi:tetraacyldisaccharide 4'-kinase